MLLSLGACAMVGVSNVKPHDYVAERRADIIGSGRLSDGTMQSLTWSRSPPMPARERSRSARTPSPVRPG
ncbi:hypothetical protein [Rhodanobacter terrae]|uniref:Uncharacterized protein n=1 Tax=Rhodanobacter terrae TaxID=418647 RepID=A0ABW0SXU7_9GAMM